MTLVNRVTITDKSGDTTYEYVAHVRTGEIYGIRSWHNHITAVVGPLHYSDLSDPSDHDYESIDCEWANEQTWRPVTLNDAPRTIHR